MSEKKEQYIPRLQNQYNVKIVSNLSSQLDIKNKMRVPKLVKISLNMGLGDAKDNKNSLKQAVDELTNIAGQKAVITHSKKARQKETHVLYQGKYQDVGNG